MTIQEMRETVELCATGALEYFFTVRETHGGIVLQGFYKEADINTGAVEEQATRKWLLSPHMTKSEVVQTVFKCVLTSYEHRVREHFTYRERRVFGPHYNVDALWSICDQLDARKGET